MARTPIGEIFDGAPKTDAPAPKLEAEVPVTEAPAAEAAPSEPAPKDATGTPDATAEPKPGKADAKPDAEGKGAMPAPKTDQEMVPLASYMAEKTGRKDWKEKAIRLEEQAIKADEQLRYWQRMAQQAQQQTPSSASAPGQPAGGQQQQPPGIDPISDPEGYARFVAQRADMGAIARNVNWSEARARQAHEDFDEVSAVFQKLAASNPTLREQALLHHDPAGFVYETGKRAKSILEIGQDPEGWRTAERERLKAEILAEQQAATPTIPVREPTPSPAAPPQSLATARNVGSRSGPAWAGPQPITEIFAKKY